MKVPNASEIMLLQVLIDAKLDDGIYHLYKNDKTPAPGDTAGSYTEANFSGYSSVDGEIDTAGITWATPTTVSGAASSTGDDFVEFEHNGGGTANDVYGWYLTDAGGNLIAAERFADAPFVMDTEGQAVRITPKFTLQSRDEVGPPPRMTSATAEGITPTTITVVFNRAVNGVSGSTWIVPRSGGIGTTSYSSGDGTATVTFSTSPDVQISDAPAYMACTVSGITDAGGVEFEPSIISLDFA